MIVEHSELFDTSQAAEFLDLGRSTLEKWRISGTGPAFVRLGARRICYPRDSLEAWLAARPRLTSTSQVAQQPRSRA